MGVTGSRGALVRPRIGPLLATGVLADAPWGPLLATGVLADALWGPLLATGVLADALWRSRPLRWMGERTPPIRSTWAARHCRLYDNAKS